MADPEARALAVFASGSGSNLQALIDRFGSGGGGGGGRGGGAGGGPSVDPAARVVLAVSDRPDVGALERAAAAGVPTVIIDPKDHDDLDAFGSALLEALRDHGVELVALAGYLRLVPENVVAAFRGRIVNIHPGPLPTFGGPGMYGRRVHQAVIGSGVKISGPTVHFVDERYDTGPIIAQWPVPVLSGDDAESLAARVLRYEHRLYPAVVSAVARGAVRLEPDGSVTTPLPRRDGIGFAAAEAARSLESMDSFWNTGR